MEWGQKLATWWLVGEIQNISLFGTLVSSRGHKNRTKKLREREREREEEKEVESRLHRAQRTSVALRSWREEDKPQKEKWKAIWV